MNPWKIKCEFELYTASVASCQGGMLHLFSEEIDFHFQSFAAVLFYISIFSFSIKYFP